MQPLLTAFLVVTGTDTWQLSPVGLSHLPMVFEVKGKALGSRTVQVLDSYLSRNLDVDLEPAHPALR